MSTFEGWLQLSVDHVVPQQAIGAGYPKAWLLDAVNTVACCRSCNDLFNRDPVVYAVPQTVEDFLALRDAMFLERKGRIIDRRKAERSWFEAHVVPDTGDLGRPGIETTFSLAWLESMGFSGFVPVAALREDYGPIPATHGVYVVMTDDPQVVTFLPANKGGWFKGRNPTVDVSLLEPRWHRDTPVLYIGKANSLRTRIRLLVRYGYGEPVAHAGGRYLWQIAGSENFVVAWREDDDPRTLESRLLAEFAAHFGSLPFANVIG